MLDASLRSALSELLSSSFNSDEIEELGAMVLGKFDLHKLTQKDRHITVPTREAAQTLVGMSLEKKKASELIQLLIETDGSTLRGRRVAVNGLEIFLANLARAGYIYDYHKRTLRERSRDREELPNWGALREGKDYIVTVASVDIVDSSALVRLAGQRTMERVYHQFWSFLRQRLWPYEGRIWSWAGDGGLVAFAMRDDHVRAVRCALEIQATLPVFNSRPENPIDRPIAVRIGLDRGNVRFMNDTGLIISETINFASHLEKASTKTGHVTISDAVASRLPASLAGLFRHSGEFEGREFFTTLRRPDGWGTPEIAEPAGAAEGAEGASAAEGVGEK